jgi:hypothetical protein
MCQISKQYAIGFVSLKKTIKIYKTRAILGAQLPRRLKTLIQAFTMSEPYYKYDEIEAEFQISRETICNIIHNCLTIVQRQQNEPKIMFCIFFKTAGPVIVRYFEQGVTVNNKSLRTNRLFSLVFALKNAKPASVTKNLKIHYDNARPNILLSVKKFIKSSKFIKLDHPPYLPDLTLSKF